MFKQSHDLMLVTWSKGHVWKPLTLCQHFAYCGVETSSANGDMYFLCHVTQQDHFVEMLCVFMGQSSSPRVTTLKGLVTLGILIVNKKNASSRTSYKYILTLKKWVEMLQTQKWYILRRSAQKLKNIYIFFPLWLPSIT